MIPAVRDPSGGCDTDGTCDAEKMLSCAFSVCGADFNSTNVCAVTFLQCVDEASIVPNVTVYEVCAGSVAIDFTDMNTCFSGSQGEALLAEASQLWNEFYPEKSPIPAVTVNGTALVAPVKEAEVTTAMCDAGSAAAVCSSTT